MWEFGCGQDIESKANADFAKRTGVTPEAERMVATFIFVTPRNWNGKSNWEKQRREEHQWKDVLVFDASDLEQWIEQSIPAQIWFAQETGIPSKEVFSLEKCWNDWKADCEPALLPSLFDQALSESKKQVLKWLEKEQEEPLMISADSIEEALAYLYVVFSEEDPLLMENKNRVIIFKKPGVLPSLVSAGKNLIVVSTSTEIEKEFAPYRKSLKSILVYSQNMANVNPDISLKPLNCFAFRSALVKMGVKHNQIGRYGRESGYSLTVLRRRLSKVPSVKTPDWGRQYAGSLVPMIFAGAWNAENSSDMSLVSRLTKNLSHEVIEGEICKLLSLDDSPVWSFEAYRGIKSKIDALFATSEAVTRFDIERFLSVAKTVLSGDDPNLDHQEEQQPGDSLLKSHNISYMLRKSIIDSFVLLAVHGNELFRKRTGVDIESRIQRMVEKLLSPLTVGTLESQSDALPAYAEAVPETFLSVIEEDLSKDESEVLKLLRPTNTFIAPARSELFRALESLAWTERYLERAVTILAQMAQTEIDDSHASRPINSLTSIFWRSYPQTSAPVDKLINVFNRLLSNFPAIGWILCMEQLKLRSSISPTHRPKWRTEGYGYDQGVPADERNKFVRNAAEKALDWPRHTKKALADLVENSWPPSEIPDEWQPKIWELIENWHTQASNMDKAWLREIMRVSVCFNIHPKARDVYEMLEPSDHILKHWWLFRHNIVTLPKEEFNAPGFDFETNHLEHKERIKEQRISALSEIHSEQGINGLIELAGYGEGQEKIGNLVLEISSFDDDEIKALIRSALDAATEENRYQMENLIRGVLEGLEDIHSEKILEELLKMGSQETFLIILLLAPFNQKTWKSVNKFQEQERLRYWEKVRIPQEFPILNSAERRESVENLIRAERPLDAVSLIEYHLKDIEADHICRLLEALVKTGNNKRNASTPSESFIEKAFKRLDEAQDIPDSHILNLECMFVDFLKWSERGIYNLEKEIAFRPELFVEMIALRYKHDHIKTNSITWLTPEESLNDRMQKIYGLFAALKRLPGRSDSGEISAKKLIRWIREVQVGCERYGLRDMGDFRIGLLLSNSPEGEDGIRPSESVRDALEEVYSKEVSEGFQMGAHSQSPAKSFYPGNPKWEIKTSYAEWAERIRYSHPQTSRTLHEIAQYYSDLENHYGVEGQKLFRLQCY